jgi:hypothetical protein
MLKQQDKQSLTYFRAAGRGGEGNGGHAKFQTCKFYGFVAPQ